MRRIATAALAVTLLLVTPALAGARGERVRGTLSATNAAAHTVKMDSRHHVRHTLAVRGSLVRLHVGQAVQLRSGTLRGVRRQATVLARGVTVLKVERLTTRQRVRPGADAFEVEGPITSLTPLTVGTATCSLPAGFSLVGFAVGDLVEMTCVRSGDAWIVHEIESRDDPRAEEDDGEDHDHSGPGRGGDDDHDGGDHGGHGGGGGGDH
jgi:hypothetical protein